MLLTIILKGYAHYQFSAQLQKDKVSYLEMDSKPTPLNSILWNAQVETETGYRVANYSLFDSKAIEFSKEFPKNHHLIAPYKDQKKVKQLIKIAAGWYVIEEIDGELFFVDLRFGQMGMDINKSPFLWRYKLIPDEAGQVRVERSRNDFGKASAGSVFSELWTRIKGN
jgi:inner membrane protein